MNELIFLPVEKERDLLTSNFDRVCLLAAEQKVLGLEIAVRNAVLVHVRGRGEDLAHEQRGVGLCEGAARDDLVVELAAADELEHHEDLVLRRDDVVELDDVGVLELAHDLDLALENLELVCVLLLLVDHLDRNLAPRRLLHPFVHDAEPSAPHLAPLLVLVVQRAPRVPRRVACTRRTRPQPQLALHLAFELQRHPRVGRCARNAVQVHDAHSDHVVCDVALCHHLERHRPVCRLLGLCLWNAVCVCQQYLKK